MVEEVHNGFINSGEAVEFICKLVEEERILAIHEAMPIGYVSEQEVHALRIRNFQPTIQKYRHDKHCIPIYVGEGHE